MSQGEVCVSEGRVLYSAQGGLQQGANARPHGMSVSRPMAFVRFLRKIGAERALYA